jgi:hypothetical protein
LSLRVYVARKRPEKSLGSAERVPDHVRFLSRKAEHEVRLETDVIETPPAQLEVDPETRIRPVPGGVSGGIAGSTGTIGGWVWDNTDDTIVALSNDHVFEHTAGVDILQQGTADGGSLPADKIGDVKRGIARSATTPNRVDCAIGDPDSSDIYDLSVLEIGPAVYATEVAVLDMLVEKYGRPATTGRRGATPVRSCSRRRRSRRTARSNLLSASILRAAAPMESSARFRTSLTG